MHQLQAILNPELGLLRSIKLQKVVSDTGDFGASTHVGIKTINHLNAKSNKTNRVITKFFKVFVPMFWISYHESMYFIHMYIEACKEVTWIRLGISCWSFKIWEYNPIMLSWYDIQIIGTKTLMNLEIWFVWFGVQVL